MSASALKKSRKVRLRPTKIEEVMIFSPSSYKPMGMMVTKKSRYDEITLFTKQNIVTLITWQLNKGKKILARRLFNLLRSRSNGNVNLNTKNLPRFLAYVDPAILGNEDRT